MGFKAPEDIKSLDNDALEASVQEALSEFESLAKIDDAELSDEQIAEMELIAGFAQSVDGERTARAEAAQARADKLSSLREAMATKSTGGDGNDGEEEPADEQAEEEAEDSMEPAESPGEIPDAEDIAEGEEAPAGDQSTPVDPTKDDPSKKKASVIRNVASRAAKSAPKVEAPARESASLVAAADVPGFSAGHKFTDLTDAGQAIMKRLKSLPTSGNGIRTQLGAVVIELPKNQFSQDNYRNADSEMLMAAANERRLDGGNLVAAGGWGAPSEIVMDFCKLETTDGLISIPEVTVKRGGLNYTKGPTFADVLALTNGYWDMTEATAEAGTELKTSLRPDLPAFTDVRLDAVGTMMEAGLLLRAGWPELVDRYAELALTAHQYKVHSKTVAGIQALAGAAINVPNGFGNAIDVLNILEVVALGERQRYALGLDATLEVLLPEWVQTVIRIDLSNRNGVDLLNVTDQMIDAFFAARGLKVQWLRAWQNVDIATAGIATALPETVEAIMYPAGSYVRGTSDVITLDTVYDSTNLKKNDYVHLFVEQGIAVTNPCASGHRITIPLKATGNVAAANINHAFGYVA